MTETLQGSLLFDPEEKVLLIGQLPKMTVSEKKTLMDALAREQEILEEALKKDGPHVMALVEKYVSDLTTAAYAARKKTLRSKEAEARMKDIRDAQEALEQTT